MSSHWAGDILEVLEHRRRLLVVAAMALSVLGVLLALLAPGFLPPRPLVGAAVGLAAALLAAAIAVGVDAADLVVRGPRHVRAAGGEVAAVLPTAPGPVAVDELADRVDERAAAGGRHWVALTPAARDAGPISPWADALGIALSARHRRVLVIDLAAGPTHDRPGVLDVVGDRMKLGAAVDFDRELLLARLGPGGDDVEALEVLTELVPRLPSDIEILVVALPHLGRPGALTAAGSLDRVLVLAEADRTARVDLIATLDAIDATTAASGVVLLSQPPAESAPSQPPAEPATAEPPADEEPPAEVPAGDEPPAEPEPALAPDAAVQLDAEGEPALVPDAAAEPDAGPEDLDATDEIPPVVPTPARAPAQPDPQTPDPHTPDPHTSEAIAVEYAAAAMAGPDALAERARFAAPPGHETVTGANLEPPPDAPLPAAVATLAQEVWSRPR